MNFKILVFRDLVMLAFTAITIWAVIVEALIVAAILFLTAIIYRTVISFILKSGTKLEFFATISMLIFAIAVIAFDRMP